MRLRRNPVKNGFGKVFERRLVCSGIEQGECWRKVFRKNFYFFRQKAGAELVAINYGVGLGEMCIGAEVVEVFAGRVNFVTSTDASHFARR